MIKAVVTDSEGATAESSVTITVGTPPVTDDMVGVSAINYWTSGGKGGTAHLEFSATVLNDSGLPVAGAVVNLDLYLGTALYSAFSGTTGSTGTVSFKVPGAPSGTYSSVVTGVVAAGYTWDGKTPDNSYTK